MTEHAQVKRSIVRRYFWIIFLSLLLLNLLILFVLLSPSQTIYAVGICDLEMVFVVTEGAVSPVSLNKAFLNHLPAKELSGSR
jgi:hypothetical protein